MQNNLGYYVVGDRITDSKLEAIEFHGATGHKIQWNFNDHVFKQTNWTVDPPGSLDFWYNKRAEQLREKYDYLILYYSGGADSFNVLKTFVDNNIFIDEIVHLHSLTGDNGDKTTPENREIFFTSAPLTKKLIENNPVYKNTKQSLIDVTGHEASVLTGKSNKWDFWYNSPHYAPHTYSYFRSIPESIPNWNNLVNQGKQVCIITGTDKPKIRQDSSLDYWIEFTDQFLYGIPAAGISLEFFYWTPDLPALIVKQAHCVKNYLENFITHDADNYHVYKGPINTDIYGRSVPDINSMTSVFRHNEQYHLSDHGLHRIIYSEWDSKTIVCPKPSSRVYSNRAAWFFKKNSPDLGQKYYLEGLIHIRNKVKNINPDFWWEYKYDANIASYNGGLTPFKKSYKLN